MSDTDDAQGHDDGSAQLGRTVGSIVLLGVVGALGVIGFAGYEIVKHWGM